MKFVGSSMQLRGHLNQVIVDQLPPLVHLEQWLVQLSVGGSAMVWQNQSRKKILVLEMVAEIHQRLTELARARRDSVKTPFSFFFSSAPKRVPVAFPAEFLDRQNQPESPHPPCLMFPHTVGRDPHKDRFVSCECIGKKNLKSSAVAPATWGSRPQKGLSASVSK